MFGASSPTLHLAGYMMTNSNVYLCDTKMITVLTLNEISVSNIEISTAKETGCSTKKSVIMEG